MNYCHCFYGILRSLVVGIAILMHEALPYCFVELLSLLLHGILWM